MGFLLRGNIGTMTASKDCWQQVQMMSGYRDPKTVMRYDHNRENLDQNAVNFLNYARKVKVAIGGSGDEK
jgi:hypothetical protein